MDTQALIELKLKQGLGLRQIKQISSTATATKTTTAYTNISGELSWKISAWWCFPKYSPPEVVRLTIIIVGPGRALR